MYDLTIIGAGPAGSTLARLVGQRYRVLLVDKRPRFGAPDCASSCKCCGGLLAPDAQRLLSKLGLGLPREVLVSPQIFVVRAIDLPSGLERYYQRFYLNMDRGRFDAWLLSLTPPEAEVRLGCRLAAFSRRGDHLELTLKENQGFSTERTRLLVGADGAFSRVRRLAFPRRPAPPAYIAIQERVEALAPLPYFSALFDPEITDYYGWTIPKDGHLLVGAALPPGRDAARRFLRFKEQLKNHGYQLGPAVRREGAWIRRPRRPWEILTGEDKIALVGEAAGFISPSSAEGLSYAMKSALLLAEVLNSSGESVEDRYQEHTRALRRQVLLKHFKSLVIFTPLLRRLVMQAGLNSVELYRP